jgi:hypothetical protein
MNDAKQRVAAWKRIILDRTADGERILVKLYPAIRFRDRRTDHFKMREGERTPSAVAYYRDGMWWCIDYGGDQKWRNPIDQYAFERGMESASFTDILKEIAREFYITLP